MRTAVLAMAAALAACGAPVTPAPADDALAGDSGAVDAATDATVDAPKSTDAVDVPDAKPDVDAGPACTCASAGDCGVASAACLIWACNCQCALVPSAAACDDGNPCTADLCNTSGVCLHTTNLGAPCDDGNACSHQDSCQAGGTCVGAIELPTAATNGCYANVCDPATGVSKPHPVPGSDGMGCDDGDACTWGEFCTTGSCGGGTAVVCNNGNPCTNASCSKTLGCVFTPAVAAIGQPCPNGGPCTTASVCTAGGTCQGQSVLAGMPVPACTVLLCNATTGAITSLQAPSGTACDDGNACTVADVCSGGTCAGTSICTANQTCDPKLGCQP